MTPTREPILWSNVAAAILSVLSLLVAMGVISLSGDQFEAVEKTLSAVGVVLWPTLATLWARKQVTPLTNPRDVDGLPLVRETGEQPIKVAERAAAERGRA